MFLRGKAMKVSRRTFVGITAISIDKNILIWYNDSKEFFKLLCLHYSSLRINATKRYAL